MKYEITEFLLSVSFGSADKVLSDLSDTFPINKVLLMALINHRITQTHRTIPFGKDLQDQFQPLSLQSSP